MVTRAYPSHACQTPCRSSQPSFHRQQFMFPILHYGTAPLPPQNCPFPWGNPDPHLIHGDCGPPHITCQTASRSVQPFLQGTSSLHHRLTVQQTDRQTTETSVAIGRIYKHQSVRMYSMHFYPSTSEFTVTATQTCRYTA